MVDELERAEEKLKDAMIPFLCAIFTQFHSKRDLWDQLLNILTELDCLISLSIVSHSEGMCRPEIVPYEGELKDRALFDIKGMVHPCVKLQPGKTFIPNDTFIEASQNPEDNMSSLILVTGPNMGGKSTILR